MTVQQFMDKMDDVANRERKVVVIVQLGNTDRNLEIADIDLGGRDIDGQPMCVVRVV
jgi:hypothetical protein